MSYGERLMVFLLNFINNLKSMIKPSQLRNNSLVAFAVIFCRLCFAQTEQITFNSFLASVEKDHPLALRAENNLDYASAQSKAARGSYDPVLNSSIESKQFNSLNYFTHAE